MGIGANTEEKKKWGYCVVTDNWQAEIEKNIYVNCNCLLFDFFNNLYEKIYKKHINKH